MSNYLSIKINAKQVFIFITTLIFAQVIIGIVVLLNWHLGGIRNELTLLPIALFDLSTDTSIPTWFSSVVLLLCASLLFLIYKVKAKYGERYQYHWLGLSLTFLVFSIDEVARIHEQLGGLVTKKIIGSTQGLFYYGWVISGFVFVSVFVLIYLKFLKNLPSQTRYMFIFSGFIFILGALGVEMFSGQHSQEYGSWNIGYALLTAAEEFLEMSGVSLFLLSILNYINKYFGEIKVSIRQKL